MLSWLRKALSTPSSTGTGAGGVANVGRGGFDYEIVGEQSYQDRLRQISAGRVERGERVIFRCRLRYEINSHTHEPAVRIDASGGRTVGYFPAEQAEAYAAAIHALEEGGKSAECQGVLVGGRPGKPNFGVWLDFKPKLLSLRN
jgi:hypothetical protein